MSGAQTGRFAGRFAVGPCGGRTRMMDRDLAKRRRSAQRLCAALLPRYESVKRGTPRAAAGDRRLAVGFVLVSTHPGREHDVYNALLKVTDVVELHPLFGEYDLIAKVEAPDFDTLGQIIVNEIRAIDGVTDTKTLTGTRF